MAKRMELAEQLIAEGLPRMEFIERFREEHPTADVRTVDRYKAQALQAIRVRREAERAHDIDARLHRLTHLSVKLEREGAYAPMMRAEELLAKITGVMEPDRHLHLHANPSAPAQSAPIVQYQGMPDHLLDTLEAALRAALSPGVPQLPPAVENAQEAPASANGEKSDEA